MFPLTLYSCCLVIEVVSSSVEFLTLVVGANSGLNWYSSDLALKL
jgi:hypothetical protein